MSRIVGTTHDILERVLKIARLVPNVERHLLDDQADAVVKASGHASGTRNNGISDPTPGLVAALKPFSDQEHHLYTKLRAIDNALDDAERACVKALTGKQPDDDTAMRCPGWNTELRSRLGGCGKPLEHWTDANGVQHNRSTLLCSGCRKAQTAHESHDHYQDK